MSSLVIAGISVAAGSWRAVGFGVCLFVLQFALLSIGAAYNAVRMRRMVTAGKNVSIARFQTDRMIGKLISFMISCAAWASVGLAAMLVAGMLGWVDTVAVPRG
nr:hypothetical protein [uncultured Novosphingobium sp.]